MKKVVLVFLGMCAGLVRAQGPAGFSVLDTHNFHSFVQMNSKPVVVKFYASWCGACKNAEPLDAKIAGDQKFKDKIVFASVDVEPNQDLSKTLGVESIPTYLVYKNGKIINKAVGGMPQMVYEAMLTPLLK
jgi:thioredoxin 1